MEKSKSSIPPRHILSGFSHSDRGLVLRRDGEWLKISARPDWWKSALIEFLLIPLPLSIAIVAFGFSKGFLQAQSSSTLFLFITPLALGLIVPQAIEYYRFQQIKDYLVRYHLTERHLSGIYFPQTSVDDVDYFSLFSGKRGDDMVHEIQLVLKNRAESERYLLVYSSVRSLQSGKIRAIFDEFTRLVGKPLF